MTYIHLSQHLKRNISSTLLISRGWGFILLLALFVSCQNHRAADDQGKTSACWIYAMLTCIEHEANLRGDSVTLSRQWLMAKELEEQTTEYYLIRQQTKKHTPTSSMMKRPDASPVSMRGVGPEALRLIDHYGLIPYQNEKTEITNSSVLERKLTLLAESSTSLSNLRENMEQLLPQFTIARKPHTQTITMTGDLRPSMRNNIQQDGGAFYYLAQRYNPHQFAESIMYCQNWQFYASVPYHPYGKPFALEVTDNHRSHEYINLPMDSIVRLVVQSLRQGHAVYWEYGTPTKEGITTSNHAMAIIGIKQQASRTARELQFICRNSYGSKWGNKGTCLVSISDFAATTCNVGIITP